MRQRPATYLSRLVGQLCKLPDETEWVEFKHNNDRPQDIGEYISALANSAALAGKPCGYLVWGVESGTHRIVGTTFSPARKRVGNEALENWLARLLSPRLHFIFREFSIDDMDMVLLEIPRAFRHPVKFQGQE